MVCLQQLQCSNSALFYKDLNEFSVFLSTLCLNTRVRMRESLVNWFSAGPRGKKRRKKGTNTGNAQNTHTNYQAHTHTYKILRHHFCIFFLLWQSWFRHTYNVTSVGCPVWYSKMTRSLHALSLNMARTVTCVHESTTMLIRTRQRTTYFFRRSLRQISYRSAPYWRRYH